MSGRLRLGLLAVVLALSAAAGAAIWRRVDAPPQGGLTEFRPEFALTDTEGRAVAPKDLEGRFLLVFFGFTHCPDICPNTLSEIAGALEILGETAALVRPVLISVDPARDTPEVLAEYVKAFHPSVLGLRGDEAATRKAAESFFSFYEASAEKDAQGNYDVLHSSSLFLIGPDGAGIRMFAYGASSEEIAADLAPRLRRFK